MYPDSSLSKLTPLFAVVTLPVGVLTAVFVGGSAALVVFIVGWLLLTPASAILFDSPAPGSTQEEEFQDLAEQQTESGSSEDPVEALRERYARGEIDEAELERRLDALLETEDVDQDDGRSIERAVNSIDTEDSGDSSAGRNTETGEVELEGE